MPDSTPAYVVGGERAAPDTADRRVRSGTVARVDGAEVARVLTAARADRGWSRRELARQLRGAAARRPDEPALPGDESLIRSVRRWENGEVWPDELNRALLCAVYGWPIARLAEHQTAPPQVQPSDELDPELLDLALRAEASDVGGIALDAVDLAVADLACRYQHTPPVDLLAVVRRRAADVTRLLDGKATLAQRRRLLVAGGWLALLAGVVHVDLGRRLAARLARDTAASLGRETGEPELAAWAAEIAAWEAITDRRWARAAQLATDGRAIAPAGSSAAVQLAVQVARAEARLGDARAVYAALDHAAAIVGDQRGDRPDAHHFHFDAAKLTGFTATALAWLGDPAAEPYASAIIAAAPSARRAASARLDLGLVLAGHDRPDEAAALTADALSSGTLVPSNMWRAAEVVGTLVERYPGLPDARDLPDRYAVAAGRAQPSDPGHGPTPSA